MLESIFRELILDHYRKPRNKGEMDSPTVTVAMRNAMCGDEIELHLDIEDDVIRTVRFTGQGCSISQASASMMTQALEGEVPRRGRGPPEAVSRYNAQGRGRAGGPAL